MGGVGGVKDQDGVCRKQGETAHCRNGLYKKSNAIVIEVTGYS